MIPIHKETKMNLYLFCYKNCMIEIAPLSQINNIVYYILQNTRMTNRKIITWYNDAQYDQ